MSIVSVFTVTVEDCIRAVAASTDCVAFLVFKATAAQIIIIQRTDNPITILCKYPVSSSLLLRDLRYLLLYIK